MLRVGFQSIRFAGVLFGLLALAACGAGGGGATLGQEEGTNPTSPEIQSPLGLPVTGQARYRGFMTLNLPEGGDVTAPSAPHVGALSVDVNFDAGADQVSGIADAFRTPQDIALSGRLFVTNGQLEASANFDAQISGTLAGTGFSNSVISGTINGGLSGQKLDAMTGVASGQVVTGTGAGTFSGSFTAANSN